MESPNIFRIIKMEICKAVNRDLIPDMSREVYKWVFQDALNQINQPKAINNKIQVIQCEREVILHTIRTSGYMCPEIEEIIKNIDQSDKHSSQKIHTINRISKLISKLPTINLDLTQNFFYLIDLDREIYKLQCKLLYLELQCEVCDMKIISPKIIHCKKCQNKCNDMYCCIECIPKVYNGNNDPYLCFKCGNFSLF